MVHLRTRLSSADSQQHVSRRYRREIFDLVLKQDVAFFDDPANASGALASNLSSYPTNILETMGFNVMLILINIVNVLSSSILAIAVGWKLGLVVVFGGKIEHVSYSDIADLSSATTPRVCRVHSHPSRIQAGRRQWQAFLK
jgi:ABC-type multidrug transport system fused ATPase/permease subunit